MNVKIRQGDLCMSVKIRQIICGFLLLFILLSSVACDKGGNISGGSDVSRSSTTSIDGSLSEQESGGQSVLDKSSNGSGSDTSDNTKPNGSTTLSSSISTASSVPISRIVESEENTGSNLSSLKGTTLNVLDWNDTGDVPGAPQVIKAFQNKTAITVKHRTASYETYTSTLASLVASGDGPDVVRLRNLNPAQLTHLQPISVSGNNFSAAIWDKKVLDYYTVNGKSYAANRNNTLLQQPAVLHYNTALITKYDLEDPYELWKSGKWTWNKFMEICEDFKDEAGSESYAWIPFSPQIYTEMQGLPMAEVKNGRFVSNFDNPDLNKHIQVMANLVQKKIVPVFYSDNPGFNTGKHLFATESVIGARRTHFHYTALKEKGTLGLVPLPSISGTTYYQIYFEIEAYGIAKGAKNAEGTPYYLEHFLNADNYDKKTFFNDARGLDVYNWSVSQKNIVSWTDDVQLPYTIGSNANAISQLYTDELKPATVAQVPTVTAKLKNLYNNSIKEYNDILIKMK